MRSLRGRAVPRSDRCLHGSVKSRSTRSCDVQEAFVHTVIHKTVPSLPPISPQGYPQAIVDTRGGGSSGPGTPIVPLTCRYMNAGRPGETKVPSTILPRTAQTDQLPIRVIHTVTHSVQSRDEHLPATLASLDSRGTAALWSRSRRGDQVSRSDALTAKNVPHGTSSPLPNVELSHQNPDPYDPEG